MPERKEPLSAIGPGIPCSSIGVSLVTAEERASMLTNANNDVDAIADGFGVRVA